MLKPERSHANYAQLLERVPGTLFLLLLLALPCHGVIQHKDARSPMKPGSHEELEYLTRLTQSISARDETPEDRWERPKKSKRPTPKAMKLQVKTLIAEFVSQMERLKNFTNSHAKKEFAQALGKRAESYVARLRVLREREEHFGPDAELFSEDPNPSFNVNQFLDLLGRGVAHVTLAIEKDPYNSEARQKLAAIGMRLLIESYLRAGATRERTPYVNLHTAQIYTAVYFSALTMHMLADGSIYPLIEAIQAWWEAGHPSAALRELPSWARENAQDAALKSIPSFLPVLLLWGTGRLSGDTEAARDREAIRSAGPLLDHFWESLDYQFAVLTSQDDRPPVRERVFDALLTGGAPPHDIVPADNCLQVLEPLLKVPNGEPL